MQSAALEDVVGNAEILLPVGHQRDAAEMPAGRNGRRCRGGWHRRRTTWRSCRSRRWRVGPDRPSSRRSPPASLICDEVERDVICAGVGEHLGRDRRTSAAVAAEPGPAMDENEDRRVGASWRDRCRASRSRSGRRPRASARRPASAPHRCWCCSAPSDVGRSRRVEDPDRRRRRVSIWSMFIQTSGPFSCCRWPDVAVFGQGGRRDHRCGSRPSMVRRVSGLRMFPA